MLDIQLLRTDLDAVVARLATRGFKFDASVFRALEEDRKRIQVNTQELQSERNQLSKTIGQAKGKGEDASQLMADVGRINDALKLEEALLNDIQARLESMLLDLPNLPHESVPVGVSEEQNVEVRRVGTPRVFDFAVKDHVDLGEGLGLLDGPEYRLIRLLLI